MQQKINKFVQLYHNDEWMKENVAKADEFDYSNIDALSRFDGTHPKVMEERIKRINWKFDHDISKRNLSVKYKFKMLVEKLTGYRIFEYKNYKVLTEAHFRSSTARRNFH
jgi:ribosomal protein S18